MTDRALKDGGGGGDKGLIRVAKIEQRSKVVCYLDSANPYWVMAHNTILTLSRLEVARNAQAFLAKFVQIAMVHPKTVKDAVRPEITCGECE